MTVHVRRAVRVAYLSRPELTDLHARRASQEMLRMWLRGGRIAKSQCRHVCATIGADTTLVQ